MLSLYVALAATQYKELSYEGDRWETWVYRGEDDAEVVAVCCNGVRQLLFESVRLAESKIMRWPFRGLLLGIASHSGCSHGQETSFYVVRNHKLIKTQMTVKGEAGGPVFRDLDRDGLPEILFDNYDWHLHHDSVPDKLLAFKMTGGQPTYWKSLSSHGRRRSYDWNF